MYPYILYNYKTAFLGKMNGKCFHVLGFDILLDSNNKPWLLEVNANPSFNIEHEVYDCKTGKTVTDESPLDKYVKSKVIEDAIYLVTK